MVMWSAHFGMRNEEQEVKKFWLQNYELSLIVVRNSDCGIKPKEVEKLRR
jgi:hypothetical protein